MPQYQQLLSRLSPLWAVANGAARKFLSPGAKRLPVPVISIGNIVAGGVGKTEMAIAIASHLIAQGKRVVVASRGYGSYWAEKGGIATSADEAVALQFPDEAVVVLRKARGVAVAVGADRYGVLMKNWDQLNPDVVLLDDGYQHFKLARDLDVLVHDFSVSSPILRDFPRHLQTSDVAVALSDVSNDRYPRDARAPWVKARYRLNGAIDPHGNVETLPNHALLVCGLGNPERFKKFLERSGVTVKDERIFPDHAKYTKKNIQELAAWQESHGGIPILTTLKDYVKLESFMKVDLSLNLRWVSIKLEFLDCENYFWQQIDRVISDGKR